MSALDELKAKVKTSYIEECIIWALKTDAYKTAAISELAAIRDAKLIATHLLIDIQTFFNSEVKACGGVGCEFELGMLDSISAFLDLNGTENNIKGNE